MTKKILILAVCCLYLTGCSQTPDPAETIPTPQTEAAEAVPNAGSDINEPSSFSDDADAETVQPHEKQTVALKPGQQNGNEKISITMTGLCQYDSLKSDSYTDTPENGNVYLAMFFEITNHDNGDDYINPETLAATADGNTAVQAVLFNAPESYAPVFSHLTDGETIQGYVAWEVPCDWKNFQMTYSGWSDSCGLTVTADVTPDMLTQPPTPDTINY